MSLLFSCVTLLLCRVAGLQEEQKLLPMTEVFSSICGSYRFQVIRIYKSEKLKMLISVTFQIMSDFKTLFLGQKRSIL